MDEYRKTQSSTRETDFKIENTVLAKLSKCFMVGTLKIILP